MGALKPRGGFFFGPLDDRPLFGWYDAPTSATCRGGALLCNPLGDDAVRAHRPLRHLAQRLAHAGFAVLRFDFHGTGDSAGDERDPDRVPTWRTDVATALAELRARSGATSIALVGLRLGATLALAAAADDGNVDRVILWGPYARGAAFHTESTRLYKMHRMLEPQSFSGGPRTRGDGEEAFGFLLTHATIADLKALDLRSLSRPPAPHVLVVGDGTGAPAEQEITDHLGTLGVAAERLVFPQSRQFLVEVPHKSRLPDDALDAMVTWLSDSPPPSPCPGPLEHAVPRSDGPGQGEGDRGGEVCGAETPITFGTRASLFAILHHPTTSSAPALPPVVLTSAGTVHRIGPHRLYVTLARRWAALGFRVLRVDLAGIGDSPPGADGVENVTYPRDGYADLAEAIDLLGAPQVILAGLCSGGDFAFQMGMRDPRVVGALILNPRTFCVNDLAAVETGNNPSVLAAASGVLAASSLPVAMGATPIPPAQPVPDSLRRMVERGVDTLLVVSDKDPGVDYVDTHWGEAMRALAGLPGFRREDVAGTDHNFTSLWSQERVRDLTTEHLTRRYLS